MLLNVRTYNCRPGTRNKHLALNEKLGRGPQTRFRGQLLPFPVTETGNVNQYLHVRAYKNAGDRERKRAALWTDAQCLAYAEESRKLDALPCQKNRLMTPAAFFALTK
jgi:hypothetical protein